MPARARSVVDVVDVVDVLVLVVELDVLALVDVVASAAVVLLVAEVVPKGHRMQPRRPPIIAPIIATSSRSLKPIRRLRSASAAAFGYGRGWCRSLRPHSLRLA